MSSVVFPRSELIPNSCCQRLPFHFAAVHPSWRNFIPGSGPAGDREKRIKSIQPPLCSVYAIAEHPDPNQRVNSSTASSRHDSAAAAVALGADKILQDRRISLKSAKILTTQNFMFGEKDDLG